MADLLDSLECSTCNNYSDYCKCQLKNYLESCPSLDVENTAHMETEPVAHSSTASENWNIPSGSGHGGVPKPQSQNQNAQQEEFNASTGSGNSQTMKDPQMLVSESIREYKICRDLLVCPLQRLCLKDDIYPHLRKLSLHMESEHEGLDMFTCRSINCGYFSIVEADRDAHEQNEHRQYHIPNVPQIICSSCKDNPVPGPTRVHIYDKHHLQTMKNFYCHSHPVAIFFRTVEDWKTHVEGCNRLYQSITELGRPQGFAKTSVKWRCPLQFCLFSFSTLSDFHKHISAHEKIIIFTCKYVNCGSVFATAAEKRAHERNELHLQSRKVASTKKNPCPFCDDHDSSQSIPLFSHIQYKHTNGNIPLTCENHFKTVYFLTNEAQFEHFQKCKQAYDSIIYKR